MIKYFYKLVLIIGLLLFTQNAFSQKKDVIQGIYYFPFDVNFEFFLKIEDNNRYEVFITTGFYNPYTCTYDYNSKGSYKIVRNKIILNPSNIEDRDWLPRCYKIRDIFFYQKGGQFKGMKIPLKKTTKYKWEDNVIINTELN